MNRLSGWENRKKLEERAKKTRRGKERRKGRVSSPVYAWLALFVDLFLRFFLTAEPVYGLKV